MLVALALSFVAALAVAPAPARADYAGFADVGTADWYVTDGSLDYALENGLLKGYGTTFGPGGKVAATWQPFSGALPASQTRACPRSPTFPRGHTTPGRLPGRRRRAS